MIDYTRRPKIDYTKPQQQDTTGRTALVKGESISLTTGIITKG